jgi:hypothetical protein
LVAARRPAVVVCKKGLKLSQGVAAWLRHEGVPADVLEGGILAWQAARLPTVPVERLPRRDSGGRTVWVTRSRPKVDRIACPWLIARFIDAEAEFLYVPADQVLAQLDALKEHDVRWRDGRAFTLAYYAGPEVSAVADEAHRRFSTDNALNTDAFFGYVETVRRKQGLHSRIKSGMSTPGKAERMESIDPDPARRPVLPMTEAQLTALPTENLPRAYTTVTLSVTPDGRTVGKRRIYMTEVSLKNRRPDEILIEYDMGEAELEAVKAIN